MWVSALFDLGHIYPPCFQYGVVRRCTASSPVPVKDPYLW